MSEPLPLDRFVERQLASGRYPSYDALVEEALRLLQEHEAEEEHGTNGETHREGEAEPVAQAQSKPIWEVAEELFGEIPDEELARLPTDGAAQVDHYVYGLPKRPA